jgi:murein DD-endopeptidase MepM/ murein hydrolase activator NlpD
MHDLLTKGKLSPVSKKAAAIFLLITMMFIGSTSSYAAGPVDEAIAATNVVSQQYEVITPRVSIREILDLPETVNPPSTIRTLDQSLESITWKPDSVLGEDTSQASSRKPTITGMITSAFGWRKHPVRGGRRHHDGIDLAARNGTPVLAPAAGRIIFAGWRTGYGNVIEIDHGNGYTSLLAHHSRILVKVNDVVDTSTVIAKAGRTGWATGVHVHVEIRYNGNLLNPIVFYVDTHLASNHK